MEKCLYVYDYVDLKNREYQKTRAKQRYLGDVDSRYSYKPRLCTPTLVGSLVNLDLPETRAINTQTAHAIITNQTRQIKNTYDTTNRSVTLDAWSYPPICEKNRKIILEHRRRPHTAGTHEVGSSRTNKVDLRPFSTGSQGRRLHTQTPSQQQSSVVAKHRHRSLTITTSTQVSTEGDRKWRNRHKIQSQNAKRLDSFPSQWPSFAGRTGNTYTGGVLDAFTGDSVAEYYNVDSRIGVNIANQLKDGSQIRVGKNGILQSNSLQVPKWTKDLQPDRSVATQSDTSDSFNVSDTWGNVKTRPNPTIVPLSWDDQLTKPDVKVIKIKDKQSDQHKPNLCERHPVIFERQVKTYNLPKRRAKLDTSYQIRQQTKTKHSIDGTQSLNNRITMITVDQVKDDDDSMCSEDYEDLLQISLQTAAAVHVKPDMQSNRTGVNGKQSATPAPSLANETQSTLTSWEYDDKAPNLPLDMVGRRSNTSQSPTRDTPAASHQLSAYIPVSPRQRVRTVPSAPSVRARRQAHTPKRAQSSPVRHQRFEEPPTQHNSHSPRPNLVRPGQLPRSGIASINATSQDGFEQEYIIISQQILPLSQHGKKRSHSAAVHVSDANYKSGTGLATGSIYCTSDVNVEYDTLSIDSMDVNKGDEDHMKHETHTRKCTCSSELKQVMSVALPHMSSDPTAVINIPIAENSELDVNSNRASSVVSFYSERSDPLDGYESSVDSNRLSPTDLENLSEQPAATNQNADPTSPPADTSKSNLLLDTAEENQKQQVELCINQIDGLNFNQNDGSVIYDPTSGSISSEKKRRTVKFADEQGRLSTSRPVEQNSNFENG